MKLLILKGKVTIDKIIMGNMYPKFEKKMNSMISTLPCYQGHLHFSFVTLTPVSKINRIDPLMGNICAKMDQNTLINC